jgi:hypothetical protein
LVDNNNIPEEILIGDIFVSIKPFILGQKEWHSQGIMVGKNKPGINGSHKNKPFSIIQG